MFLSSLSSSSFSSAILPSLINCYCPPCFCFGLFLPPTLAFLVASSHIYFRLPVPVSTFCSLFSSLILFHSFRQFPLIYDHISRILFLLLIPPHFSNQPFCSFFPHCNPPPLSNFVLLCDPWCSRGSDYLLVLKQYCLVSRYQRLWRSNSSTVLLGRWR